MMRTRALTILLSNQKAGVDTPCLPDYTSHNAIVNGGKSPLDGTQAPHNFRTNTTTPWNEKQKLHLDRPHLVSPPSVCYTQPSPPVHPATTGACSGQQESGDIPAPCLPTAAAAAAPGQDAQTIIPKAVFLHADRPRLRWGGRWARAKLAREERKYERVRALWLLEQDHGFLPGYDDKHAFVAAVFARELESPWVLAWLRELMSEEDVGRILAAREGAAAAAGAGEEGVAR